jgi:alpha-D-xyloside xylohydrolase
MDWWTGEVIEGPGEKTVDAPLGVLPLYQRLGSIIPLLRPTIDTLAPTDQPDLVDSLATTPDLLHAKVVLSSSHPLWEPCYDQTLLKAAGEEDGVRLEYAAGSLYTGGIHWELPGFGPAPESVEDEKAGPLEQAESVEQLYEKGEPAWAWTAEMGGTLHVHLPDAGEWTTIVKR